jgi:hypothetical protein
MSFALFKKIQTEITMAKTDSNATKALSKKAISKNGNGQNGKPKKDIAASYNRYKLYQGKQYTGMAIGRSHKWYYDKGIWLDKKVTPERWVINFEVNKRRAGKAPEGSGAKVGTEYHWYVLAHQMVKKLDANTYSTEMNGLKFKLAHRRADNGKWSLSDKSQRNHLIKILQDYIKELEEESIEEFIAQEQEPFNTKKSKSAPQADKTKPAKKKTIKRKKELEEA